MTITILKMVSTQVLMEGQYDVWVTFYHYNQYYIVYAHVL